MIKPIFQCQYSRNQTLICLAENDSTRIEEEMVTTASHVTKENEEDAETELSVVAVWGSIFFLQQTGERWSDAK